MDHIINKLTAGNYWLTKSMEFNRVTTSGTLWYLKKWVTYYYYIFLKSNMYEQDYSDIAEIFNNFINTLPEKVQPSASNFFFDKDIRKEEGFNSYQNFIRNMPHFSSQNEESDYKLLSKKFYFTYIMNIGGQSSYKAITKNLIDKGSTFTETLKTVKQKMLNDGHNERKFNIDIKNDFHASLRNERQIFFYYGIFHGRQESSLNGFYNLTPIGKAILKIGFDEIVVLWEHQKLKMTSQSPVSDIKNLNQSYALNNFSINYHPYLTLLKSIDSLGKLDYSAYKYGIARTSSLQDFEVLLEALATRKEEYLIAAQEKIKSFERKADNVDEDFQKELKKYLLGVYDLNKDLALNPYSFLKLESGSSITISNSDKLKFTIKVYDKLVNNLDRIYSNKYVNFENALKEKYNADVNNQSYKISASVRYDWAKYNINFEPSALLYQFYWGICCKINQFDLKLTKVKIEEGYLLYKNLINNLGFNKSKFTQLLIDLQLHINDEKPFILDSNSEDIYTIIDPIEVNIEVTINNLEVLSKRALEANSYESLNRKRSNSLRRNLKNYYFNNYKSENDLIACECCSETTFKNTNSSPYLEFHHLIPFSTDSGPDHYLNLFGLCSNCHSKMHHLHPSLKDEIYLNLSRNNHFQKNYIERMESLYNSGFLEAIHLDYLLKENIINENDYNNFMSRSSNAA